jgi:hypothetical protein
MDNRETRATYWVQDTERRQAKQINTERRQAKQINTERRQAKQINTERRQAKQINTERRQAKQINTKLKNEQHRPHQKKMVNLGACHDIAKILVIWK